MPGLSIPPKCPSCNGPMVVVKLECASCGTEITGEYDLCSVCRLEGEMRELFDLFLGSRGNLKKVQRDLGVSYPTVRQRIREMFVALGQESAPVDPAVILERLRNGEIDMATAEKLLAGEEG